MSLSDWSIHRRRFHPSELPSPADQPPVRPSGKPLGTVPGHSSALDSITRQIEQISRPAPHSEALRNDAVRSERRCRPAIDEAISRLDARLSQISNPHAGETAKLATTNSTLVERAAAQVYRPSPPISPASLDFASQRSPHARTNRPVPTILPPRSAPPMVPERRRGRTFSSLERI